MEWLLAIFSPIRFSLLLSLVNEYAISVFGNFHVCLLLSLVMQNNLDKKLFEMRHTHTQREIEIERKKQQCPYHIKNKIQSINSSNFSVFAS